MPRPRRIVPAFAAVLAILLIAEASAMPARPRLLVILVIDQFRTEYIERFASQWGSGLRRLIDHGAWFRHAAFSHLNTVTCAGHATIATGAVPAVHGMILNEWWDRTAQRAVLCTADERAQVVSLGSAPAVAHGSGRLEVPTLADEMRAQLRPPSRVVSLSMKARSALMMAGRGGDVVLWFENGVWMSPAWGSGDAVPAVADWLRAHPVETDRDRVWDRLLPRERYLFADDPTGKQPLKGWDVSLPHPIGSDRTPSGFYTQWEHSPFADEYLARLAAHAVSRLDLGRRGATDYLAISFSALDRIGHKMGPHSHEVQDAIVRLDRAVGALLDQIDRQTGGRFVVALSSDHGVSAVPEQMQAAGTDAGRTRSADVAGRVDAALSRVLGPGRYVARLFYTDLYFTPGLYERLRSDPAAMRAAIAAASNAPGIARVFRADEVANQRQAPDPLLRAAANSYHPRRSGDLILVPKPNWILSTAAATHGTASRYDTDVPVVLMGPGIRRGTILTEATPADIAPTLASLVGVRLPHATGRVLREALAPGSDRVSGAPSAEGSRVRH